MKPITNNQFFLATMAGEYDGELPEPVTPDQMYYKKIIQRIDSGGGGSVSPEQIDAAIESYFNTHDADIVTETELSEALSGKQNTLTAGENINIETVNGELTISATDTKYSDATQQTAGLMSVADKTKLDGITAAKMQAWDAAEQNVNADWNAESGDAQILNKPDLTVFALADDMTTALTGKVDKETGKSLITSDERTKLNGIETNAQVNTVTGVKGNSESDYRTGEINISPVNIGLGNVDNTSDADKPISTATQTALDEKQDMLTFDNVPTENSDNPVKSGGVYSALIGKISTSAKGANGGVAELDANGKVPSSQLPSYVDDVSEYATISDFPAAGESGKIYIALNTNLAYRWGGSDFVEISPSLALGTTDSTAYRGDWGAADRAAIGTLSDLQTAEKGNLVAAVNELKTALNNTQGTLTFDNIPIEGSTNPVKSGGIYTVLASKQNALTIDSAPTSGSNNPVESGGVYAALSDKQNTLTFDSAPTQNSKNPVTSGGIYSALDNKVDAEPNKGLSSNDFTAADKTKLDGIETGAEVNQNAFSNVKVGSTTVAADTKQDTLELVAGSNVTLTTDATNDKITISAADTTASTILFDTVTPLSLSGTTSVTLSDYLSNYSIVDVFYSQTYINQINGWACSRSVKKTNGNWVDVSCVEYFASGADMAIRPYIIGLANNTLTLKQAPSNSKIYIWHVVGYK